MVMLTSLNEMCCHFSSGFFLFYSAIIMVCIKQQTHTNNKQKKASLVCLLSSLYHFSIPPPHTTTGRMQYRLNKTRKRWSKHSWPDKRPDKDNSTHCKGNWHHVIKPNSKYPMFSINMQCPSLLFALAN